MDKNKISIRDSSSCASDTCCVTGCSSKMNVAEGIHLYKFPKNENIIHKWYHNLQINLNIISKSKRKICTKHFDKTFVGKKKLLDGAIPTNFLGHKKDIQLFIPCKLNTCKKRIQRKCVVPNCKMSTQKKPLFSFPTNAELRQKWIDLFHLQNNNCTKYLYACQDHFETQNIGKKNLRKNVIPTKNLVLSNVQNDTSLTNLVDTLKKNDDIYNFDLESSVGTVQIPKRVYEGPASKSTNICYESLTLEDIPNLPSPIKKRRTSEVSEILFCYQCKLKEENLVYFKKQTQQYATKCQKLREENIELKNKLKKFQNEQDNIQNEIEMLEHVNNNTKQFCKMLLSNKNLYNADQKHLAQNINFKSASFYSFLRDELKLHLPSQSSIYNWCPIKNLQPGFNTCLVNNLQNLVNKMDDQYKQVVLMIDEIHIRRDLTYNLSQDLIDGVTDYGAYEREKSIGKQICVIMLRGLFCNWKYVLSYFISEKGLSSEKLKDILYKNLKISFEIGLKVRCVVCDQGPNNRKFFKLLNITEEKPYASYNGNKVFYVFDTPHLIKSMRNTLLTYDLTSNEGIISWDVLLEIYDIDTKNENIKMCPKITQRHIHPSTFDKMNVSLAAQVLSRSMASAINTCLANNFFSEKTKLKAKATSEFVLKINNIFDILNSRNLKEKNYFKRPIQKDGPQTQNLRDMLEYLKSLKLPAKKRNFCISGLILTINGIIGLSQDVFACNSPKIEFLLTSRINQDPLENIFAQVRSKGGNNKNPSVCEFNWIIARIMSMRIVTFMHSNKNCENDTDIMLDWETGISENINLTFSDSDESQILSEAEENINNLILDDDIGGLNRPEADPAKMYFVGYGLFKILSHKINCTKCSEIMIRNDSLLNLPSEQLIKYKNFENKSDQIFLKIPSDKFFEICNQNFNVFKHIFDNFWHNVNLKKQIVEACVSKTNELYPDWFDPENECYDHRKTILDFLVLVLLRKNCSWLAKNSTEPFNRTSSSHHRLLILQQ